jgi:beta-lactam-binding protein with PASTA domain
MNLYLFSWIIPFLIFTASFLSVSLWYPHQVIITPDICGLNPTLAIKNTSQVGLGLRIIGRKFEASLPEDTIIQQSPNPGISSKAGQSVLCVLSKKNSHTCAPNLCNLLPSQVFAVASEMDLHIETHNIPSTLPSAVSIAQSPSPGTTLEERKITIYLAQPASVVYSIPHLVGLSINKVQTLTKSLPWTISIYNPEINHVCSQCKVKEQRPLAGSLWHSDTQPLSFVLLVDHIF